MTPKTYRFAPLAAWLSLLAILISAGQAQAADPAELLPPEQAFRYALSADAEAITVRWDIAEGYYLYRERMGYASGSDNATLGEPAYPQGKVKEDEFFGRMEVYRGTKSVRIPYQGSAAGGPLQLEIRSQGCADIGICYPPQKWTGSVILPAALNTGGGAAGPDLRSLLDGAPATGQEFLPPDEAFRLYADMADPYTLRVTWDIADGYYLYRDKFAFQSTSASAQLGAPRRPAGEPKVDEFFGATQVYYNRAEILIPISRASPDAGDLEIDVAFQGCAEDGICYPPMTRSTLVILPAATGAGGSSSLLASLGEDGVQAPVSEQDRLANMIGSGSLPLVLASFFGLGLLLAFTPCVFPMVPILSGIIVGQGPNLSLGRAFSLSLVYVLAMAATYTVAGVATALMGQNLQAIFQNPAILVTFAAVFVVLSLAMFGVYDLQLPASWQGRLAEMSGRQRGGTLAGVAVMGVLSALIVGPCVAAPLAATLIFIGQSGDPVRGGLVLFTLSLGMGAPLLAFGTSAGRLLPKAGRWMEVIKFGFGILMLGVAIWMVSRILPGPIALLAWAALALFTAVSIWRTAGYAGGGWPALSRTAAALSFVYGAVLIASAAAGGSNPLRPLDAFGGGNVQHLEFTRIKTVADLDRMVAQAGTEGRATMLDFYADWCVSCKEMEHYTFTDPDVQAALGNTLLLQADVTANDAEDKALLQRFQIFGPPTIAFFGRDGQERKPYRVVGFMPADEFAPLARTAVSQ